PDAFLAVDYMLERFAWLVECRVVRAERMRQNLDASHGLYFSQRLLLALVASSLDKFALEIRHLARTEVSEVQEPFGRGQKGSSAMQHRRNPVVAERICGLARVVRAAAHVGLENVALWHERAISHS
ncbi:MAG: lyase family protein, partial [Gaiellaceae bacterium]